MQQLLLNLLNERIHHNGECARLLHGRGKKWPELEHLSIDWYPPHVLITTYKEISEEEKKVLVSVIQQTSLKPESILLQKRYLKGEDVEALAGTLPDEAIAVENSEKYLISLKTPQNIGFFLDMAIGRRYVKENSAGKSVLNLFSYTCSISVAALKGGALEVANYDMSKAALKVGEANHKLNGIDLRKVKFVSHDIMKSFGNITRKGPYDLIIIDPPTNQGLSFKVERDYHKIVKRLNDMTNPNAVIMACLNSPHLTSKFILDLFLEHAPHFQFERMDYSSFSSMEKDLEQGLKILYFKKIT